MRLISVERGPSPRDPSWTRLTGRVAPDGAEPFDLWFEVPPELAANLSDTGNPWLSALAPFAVTRHEALELPLPVDRKLFEGVAAAMQVWEAWFPEHYHPIDVRADFLEPDAAVAGTRTAAFFSAGVDSFYTALRHQPGGDAVHRVVIDELLTIWGFDIPIDRADAIRRLRERIDAVAASLGMSAVMVATNLRESPWNVSNWARISQGPALAAIAQLLEGRYRLVLAPSSLSYGAGRPWGTHPLVDPLFSTACQEFRDDGALFRRSQKIAAVAGSRLAMQHLRVCWMGRSDTNCGHCEKCLRSLTEFELIGLRDRCVTFPPGSWSVDALASLRLRHDLDRRQIERLRVAALARGRTDIARAIARAIRAYDLRCWAVRTARAVGLRRQPELS